MGDDAARSALEDFAPAALAPPTTHTGVGAFTLSAKQQEKIERPMVVELFSNYLWPSGLYTAEDRSSFQLPAHS